MKSIISLITIIILLEVHGISAIAQQGEILWSEDFEGDWTENWSVDAGTWEIGVPTSGPGNVHGGQNCAATVLGGNYSEPVATRLIKYTSFIVPAASENPRIRFWYWFSFSSTSDWGEVQIRVNNGDWVPVSNRLNYQGGDVWSLGLIDLSEYANSSIQVAFFFQSVNDGTSTPDVSSGWYIDDVSLVTGPYEFNNPEGFESGFGDWSVDEGTWEVGAPSSGPANVHGGVNCAGTNLNGDYQEPSTSRLVSPPFVVPAASENPRIQFWHWFSFSSTSDWGEVQISTNGGISWESITSKFINTSSDTWTLYNVSLSSYAGSSVQFGFYFQSVNDGTSTPDVSSGWYIDDVIIDDNSDLTVNAGPDITINSGSSEVLNSSVTGGTQPYTYEWTPLEGLNNASILNPLVSPADTTVYTLKVIDSHGCFRTDHVTVNVAILSGNEVESREKVVIYPIPADNELFISIENETTISEINIYNQIGQKVFNRNKLTDVIDISMLNQGMYIIELIFTDKKIREKFIKK